MIGPVPSEQAATAKLVSSANKSGTLWHAE